MDYSQGKECISQEDIPLFTVVAKYVHDIFSGNWDKYSLNDIKKVIYGTLYKRNLVTEDGSDINGLEMEFPTIRPLILNCLIRDKMINLMICNKDTITGERIQPIFYIYLIALLCPDSGEFYQRIGVLQELDQSLSMIAVTREVKNREHDITQRIESKFNGDFSFVSFVKENPTYVVIRHEKCGEKRPRNVYAFLGSKGYCPVCKCFSIPKHDMDEIHQKYRDKLLDYAGPEYVIDEFLEKGYAMIRHTACGYPHRVMIKDFLNQKRCKGCGQIISRL